MLMTLANQFRNSIVVYASDLLYENHENTETAQTWSILSDRLAESTDSLIDRINTIYELMLQTPIYLDGLNGDLIPSIQSNLLEDSFRLAAELLIVSFYSILENYCPNIYLK